MREIATRTAIAVFSSAIAVFVYHWWTAMPVVKHSYTVVTYYEVKDKGIQLPVVYNIDNLDGCLYVAYKMDHLNSMMKSYCVVKDKEARYEY